MTPENVASAVTQHAGLTPENPELVAKYAGHLERSPLTGHNPRTYLGAVRGYLAWLQEAPIDGDGVARPTVDPDYTATVGMDRDQARALVAAADANTGA